MGTGEYCAFNGERGITIDSGFERDYHLDDYPGNIRAIVNEGASII